MASQSADKIAQVLNDPEFIALPAKEQDSLLKELFPDEVASVSSAQPPPMTPMAPDRAGWDTPQEGSAAKRFVHGAWNVLNPVNLVSGVSSAIGSASDAISEKGLVGAALSGAKSAVDAQSRGFVNAWDEAYAGRPIEALGQAVSGALPVFGPIARSIGERAAQTGDLAGAFGEGFGVGVLPEVTRNAPGNLSAAGRGTMAAARGAAGVTAKMIPNPRIAGAIAGISAGIGAAGQNPSWALVAAERSAYFTENMLKRLKGSLTNFSIPPAKRAAMKAEADALEVQLAGEKQALEELRQNAAVEDKVLKSDLARESKMAKMDRPKNLRSIAKNGSRPEQERGTLGSIAVSREFARGENPAGLPAAAEAPRSLPRQSGAIEKADPSLPLAERAEINKAKGSKATLEREARSQEIGAKTDASGWGDTLQMISEMKQIVKGKKFDRAAYDALPDKYKKTFTFSQARLFAEQAK